MRYIAIEEAFSVPELEDRHPSPWLGFRFSQRHITDWARKLPDFTEYRLPEMDTASIDVQVLSLTVLGLQADTEAPAARDDARFANDYLARVVAQHPDRFRGFAALPMQDPGAAAAELGRCVREIGFCGALVNDHFHGALPRRATLRRAVGGAGRAVGAAVHASRRSARRSLEGTRRPPRTVRVLRRLPLRVQPRSRGPGSSGPRSATPTGRRSLMATPSGSCGSDLSSQNHGNIGGTHQ